MTAAYQKILFTDITVNRESRQRRELPAIKELAESIRANGLINPLTVNRENELICGERRYEAIKLLNWLEVDVHYFEDLGEIEQLVVELQENLKRNALSWQDSVKAVLKIHKANVADQTHWTIEDTAELLSSSKTLIHKQIQLGKELEKEKTELANETTMFSAYNKLQRTMKRKADSELEQLTDIVLGDVETLDNLLEEAEAGEEAISTLLPQQSGSKAASTACKIKPLTQKVEFQCADSIEFMRNYTGKKFNVLHCDFPYGINHDKSEMGGAKKFGSYEDGAEIYYNLLEAMLENLDKLLYPEAHIMLWLSMEHYENTLTIFKQLNKANLDLTVYKTPLVWLKSCNTGIVKDPKRTPRNVTEFCLYINRGGKEIITNVANAYAAPSNKNNRLHQSEKPEPMLKHFFRMFVDEYTDILDPTCGAGSAIRAAHAMGAKRAIGLDLNSEYIEIAQQALKENRTKDLLNKKLKGD